MSRSSLLVLVFAILTVLGCKATPRSRGPDELVSLEGGGWTQTPKKKKTATIVDAGELYSSINLGDCLTWPTPQAKSQGGADAWGDWYPKNGMSGTVLGTSAHCSDTSVTVYIIDFGDGHIAALNNKGVQLGEGDGEAAPSVASQPSVKIISSGKMYDLINQTTCLTWPSAAVKAAGGQSGWGGWKPKDGDMGVAIGKTTHCNQASVTVIFVQIGSHYVPIDEKGIVYLSGSGAAVPWVTGGGIATAPPPPPVVPKAGAGTVESGRVRIVDTGEIYTTINTTDCLSWPDDDTKLQAGKNSWGGWSPKNGDVGVVVWKATHCSGGNVVLVVRVGDKYLVPIGKKGVAPE